MSQLALPLKLDDHAVFASFWPENNEGAVAFLKDLATTGQGPGAWIWGKHATGKTHLLQAVCERRGDDATYIPLDHVMTAGAVILDGLATRRFVCVDDIDKVAGDAEWELALFELYNQMADAGGQVIVSAATPPREAAIELADLGSRLSMLPAFHLNELSEAGRIAALQLRARHRGLDLPDETASFMLNRARRDMANLYRLLDRLDTAALAAQRRLTIPFVKEVLDEAD